MKLHVVVTDDDGNTFEGEAILTPTVGASTKRKAKPKGQRGDGSRPATLDFTLPTRAFMSRYGRGLGGPPRFTLLLARLTHGKPGAVVTRGKIEAEWNRMKEVLGGRFNPSCTTRAKTKGWVDAPNKGGYVLLPGWQGALGRNE